MPAVSSLFKKSTIYLAILLLIVPIIVNPQAAEARIRLGDGGLADTDSTDDTSSGGTSGEDTTISFSCPFNSRGRELAGPPSRFGYVVLTGNDTGSSMLVNDVALSINHASGTISGTLDKATTIESWYEAGDTKVTLDIWLCDSRGRSTSCSADDVASFAASCDYNQGGGPPQGAGQQQPPGPGGGGGTSTACEETVKVVFNGKTLVEAIDPRCFCQFDIDAETWFRWKARYTEISTKTDSNELKDNLDAKAEPADLFLDTKDGRMEWGTSAQKLTGGRNVSNNVNVEVKAQGFDLNSDLILERSWDFSVSAIQGYIRPTQQVVNVHQDESETMFLVSVSPQECETRAEFDVVGESRAKVVSIAESNLSGRHNEHPEKHFSGAYTQGILDKPNDPASKPIAVVQEKDGTKHWLEKRSTLGAGGETKPGKGLKVTPNWVEVLKSILERIPILRDIISVINAAEDYLVIDFAKAGENLKRDPQVGKQTWKWHDKEWTQVWITNAHIAGVDAGAYDLLKWGTRGDQTAISRTDIKHEMTIVGKLRTGARTSDIKEVLRITVKPDADDVIEVGKRKFTIIAPPVTVTKVNSAAGVRWQEVNTVALEILKEFIKNFSSRVTDFPAARLSVILSQAAEKIEINDLEAAIGMLRAFIEAVEADQRRDKPQIDIGDADRFLNAARELVKRLDQFKK